MVGLEVEDDKNKKLKRMQSTGTTWSQVILLLQFYQIDPEKQHEKALRNGLVVPEAMDSETIEVLEKIDRMRMGCVPLSEIRSALHTLKKFNKIFETMEEETSDFRNE